MHTKNFDTFFKRWVQFRVGVIPRLPEFTPIMVHKIDLLSTFPFTKLSQQSFDVELDLKISVHISRIMFTSFYHGS